MKNKKMAKQNKETPSGKSIWVNAGAERHDIVIGRGKSPRLLTGKYASAQIRFARILPKQNNKAPDGIEFNLMRENRHCANKGAR
jgi:hypothetical protein